MPNLPPPTLSGVSYEKNANRISCNWQPGSGQYFIIGLFTNGSLIDQASAMGFGGELIPSQTLDENTLYQVQVAQTDSFGGTPGPFGPPANLIVSPLKNIEVNNNGVQIDVSWDCPALGNVTGGLVYVVDQQSGDTVIMEQCEGTRCLLDPGGKLDPSKKYQIVAYGTCGISKGPASDYSDLICQIPTLDRVMYNILAEGTGCQIQAVSNISLPDNTLLQLTVYQGSDVAARESQPFTILSLTLGYSLDPSYIYMCRLRYQSGGSVGPESQEVPLLTAPPRLLKTFFDGQAVEAFWENPDLPPRPAWGSAGIVEGTSVAGDGTFLGEYGKIIPTQPIDPVKSYFIQLNPVLGKSRGPMANQIPVIAWTKNIQSAAYDGNCLKVCWEAGQGPNVTGYNLLIKSGGSVLRSVPMAGADLANGYKIVDIELSPGASCQAALQAVGQLSEGQPGPPQDIITAVPGIRSIVTGGDSIIVTLIEPTVKTAVAGYQGLLYQGGCVVAGPVAATLKDGQYRIEFPVGGQGGISLLETRDYYARVQAVGSTPLVFQGPLSPAGQCLVQAPEILNGGMNGYQWTMEWTPCREVVVTGYKITLSDPNGNNPQYFYTTRTCHTGLNNSSGNQIMASVQAVGDTAEGPLSAPKNLYGDGANYYFSATGASAPAYLYRSYSHPPQAEDINLYLPDLFNRDPQIQSDIFKLSKPSGSPAGFPYLLTIDRDSAAWKFTPADRNVLWSSYTDFLKDLDQDSSGGGPLLKPGAFNLLRQIIARALPLTFPEQLSYLYGFKADESCVDLIPGMRVRLDGEVRQYVGPPNDTNKYLNGFVPSGTVYLYLDDYLLNHDRLTGFDAYLSLSARPDVPSTQNIGGGGILDLYAPLGRRALYRLIYPQMIPGSSSMGYANLTYNMLVLGADNYTDLDGAARQYLAQGNFSGYDNKIIVTFFRGRTVLIPEIPVEINGSMRYVPIGTTIRSILARLGQVPASGRFLGSIAMERSTVNLVQTVKEAQSATTTPDRTKILLAESVMDGYADGTVYLDLPLLQGDRILY